jgi:hypothetical protein
VPRATDGQVDAATVLVGGGPPALPGEVTIGFRRGRQIPDKLINLMADEEILEGGVANAGAVTRRGDHVLRPATRQTELLHQLFRYVRRRGFDGVPDPVGIEPDGRDSLVFIAGDVAVPPYPPWVQTDEALASIAALLARFHRAAEGFDAGPDAPWDRELADPHGGPVVCHNDVCLENVVFRDGVAVAFLDFDFAAPGRPIYDLACMARMCVPLDTPDDAAVWGRREFDPFRRLRIVADAYDLSADREALVEVIEADLVHGGEFVRRRVERAEPAFIEMWDRGGGQARYDRRREWFESNRGRFLEALE